MRGVHSGNLLGCSFGGSVGLVGQMVTVLDSHGNYLGACTTTTGGAFSGTVTIDSPSEAVTFNTAAFTGYAATTFSETLSCGSNALGNLHPTPVVTNAPTINPIGGSHGYCGSPVVQVVNLTGITDGNGGTALPITVIATSSNTGLVPTPTVSYTSPNTTGTLTFTPSPGSGSALRSSCSCRTTDQPHAEA